MKRLLTLLLCVSCFAALGQYEVGDAGPAGGWVFFVDENDEFDDWDYLEVWPHTFSFFQMLVCDTSPFLSSADLGSGESNTNTFTTDDDTFSAFDFATLFDGGGREDWFVPSKSELEILNASAVSELINSGEGYEAVASSTGFNCNWYTFDTEGGWSTQEDLFSWLRVLPVRSFQVSDEGTKCGPGTTWNQDSGTCEVANVSDTDYDGCVGINDFLIHLSNFGSGCGPEPAWACSDPLEYQGYDYETVQIGEQCWFAENLRAENYRNGENILGGVSASDWDLLAEGATAIYGEGSSAVANGNEDAFSNLSAHGRLYNFFAVSDERSLCPYGWQVPSTVDFEVLLEEVETTDALKGFESSSGFNATFGGRRTGNGSFFYESVQAGYWTQTENIDFPGDSFNYILGQNESVHYPNSLSGVWDSTSKKVGFSVRCIKD